MELRPLQPSNFTVLRRHPQLSAQFGELNKIIKRVSCVADPVRNDVESAPPAPLPSPTVAWSRRVVGTRLFDAFILGCIVVAGVVTGIEIEYDHDGESHLSPTSRGVIATFTHLTNVAFVVEVGLKLVATGGEVMRFFNPASGRSKLLMAVEVSARAWVPKEVSQNFALRQGHAHTLGLALLTISTSDSSSRRDLVRCRQKNK